MIELEIKCDGNVMDCSDPTTQAAYPSTVAPGPNWYYLFANTPIVGCNYTRYNVQPGNSSSPSTSVHYLLPGSCPCDLEIELFGVGYTLTGNTIFDNSTTGHLTDNLGTSGGCCPGGISVNFDYANCTLYLTMPSCP